MTADRLLALYEKVAEAPDAIARLRRFVLDLAVRGKLVAQDPADEPASELLKQIAAEKARLVEAGEIRKKAAQDPKMAEPPHKLPASWRWVSLGSVFLYDAGAKRDPKSLDSSLWLLELEDIEKETGRLLSRVAVADRESKSTKSEFRPGDILYGKLRPYLTKVLVASEPGYSTTEIVTIRPFIPLCSEYCALALRRPDFVDYVTRLGQGTKMPRLRTEDAVVSPFPLPPLAEQHRIVAKVDELMVLLDRLEAARTVRETTRDRLTAASLARLTAPDTDAETFPTHARFTLDALPALTARPDQIKQLRQTILNLAVRGKLVEQDPADEPASELLKRIAVEKASSGKRQKELPEIDAYELGELPPNWSAVPLIALGEWAIGSGFPKNEQGETDGPYFFLKVSDMNLPENEKFVTTANNTIDDEAAKRMRAAIHPPGTIIFPKIGGAIATNKRRILTRGSAIDNNCLGITFASDIDVEWAYLLLTTLDLTRYQAGTAVPALQQGTLAAIPIPLPPLAEQHRIIAKVDALMALCDRLEATLATAYTTRQRLLEALLREALDPAAQAVTEAAE
jgi:type I restriction enzyme S subunit